MTYIFNSLSSSNISDLTFLYKKVFGNNVSVDFVKKKYNTSHISLSYFGHIAYHNNKPVAFHGAIPVAMQHNGVTEIAAQYGDAMTLKGHTGNGLFTKLGELTDLQLKKAGITFVWGFPNQNSEYGYINKLNWDFKERMIGFKIKTHTFPLDKILHQFTITNNTFNNHIKRILKKYKTDKIIQGSISKDKNFVTVLRNIDYYNYKSIADNFTIEIDGVLFWVKMKNGLLIGDIETHNDVNFYTALEKLKKIAFKNGIGELIFQASPDTQISKLLQSQNELQFNSWVVGYKNFTSKFPLEKLKFTYGDLDTY